MRIKYVVSLRRSILKGVILFAVLIISNNISAYAFLPDRSCVVSGYIKAGEDDNEDFLESQGLTLINKVDVNGDWGYLAEFKNLNNPSTVPKYCLVLTGAPYNMGYQASSLMPWQANKMLTEFMLVIGLEQLGYLGIDLDPYSPEGQKAFGIIYELIIEFAEEAESVIPDYIKEEFRGIVDGLNAAGYKDVTFNDVMLLNQGIDATYFFLMSVAGKVYNKKAIRRARITLLKLIRLLNEMNPEGKYSIDWPSVWNTDYSDFLKFGCNEFIVSGKTTLNDEILHGRDFMFGTAGIYQDVSCVIVYLPDDGKPFVTVAPPGFVGHTVGVNIDGISMGQDVSQGDSYGSNMGVGSMMVIRHILQYGSSLQEAVDMVKEIPRGVPWIYVIGDDAIDENLGAGVTLEAGASEPAFEGPDVLPLWEQRLLKRHIRKLDDTFPDRGIMVRSAKWNFPPEFEIAGLSLSVPGKFYHDKETYTVKVEFPPQIEEDDNVLIATNHFLIPRMRFLQFDPAFFIVYADGVLSDSVWRYEQMADLIMDKDYYGKIDFFGSDPEMPAEGSAGWIIDFLNTKRTDYYKGGLFSEVPGHHVIINNTTKELKGLFGYMSDPWVGINLPQFYEEYSESH
ncbi:MAG: carcinine hydrolase/isopenicillin-N N-acyltransferase family protein [Thermodesulfobacteriota bacterium]|nr:carcinine hydrolase/isopenicillin-N N-acyltransferase family protein [Thermodesulfobacteriota bacterium]